jgi:predicted HD phosphohydrolase
MQLIETTEQLVEALNERPEHVARCLQRLNRFNGQHPTSNVLVHSIDVALRIKRQGCCRDAVTFGLLHDCHELITGDHPKQHKSDDVILWQHAIDAQLMIAFGIDLLNDEIRLIWAADTESGNDEHHYGQEVTYHGVSSDPVQQFVDMLNAWKDWRNECPY